MLPTMGVVGVPQGRERSKALNDMTEHLVSSPEYLWYLHQGWKWDSLRQCTGWAREVQ
jgi:hypothetical protein